MEKRGFIKTILFFVFAVFIFWGPSNRQASSQNVDKLKEDINNHSEKIKQLEQEIKVYEKEIEVVGKQASSLQTAVKTLDINQKKITTEIKKTETNIEKTNLNIEKLGDEISSIEVKIGSNSKAVQKSIRELDQKENRSLVEIFLSSQSLAEALGEYDTSVQFQTKVREQSEDLSNYKEELGGKKQETELEKKSLLGLKSELGDKNQILEINKKEKTSLLTQTKSKETEYKNMLSLAQAEKEKFEKELFNFESQLKRAIDPSSFPTSGKGILSYPLDNIVVTQYFGKTVDAKKLYVSGTHNGIDFRATRGTPVKSAASGVVKGVGNTDAQKGCYSYGQWVLIEHPNGLTTLYAHLDLIKVAAGQNVSTGDVIGYSGKTGYATGPHLHFTVYASQGVEIQRYSSSKNCKNVDIPIAPSNGYLDPMLYF